jgi:hypothetical protein
VSLRPVPSPAYTATAHRFGHEYALCNLTCPVSFFSSSSGSGFAVPHTEHRRRPGRLSSYVHAPHVHGPFAWYRCILDTKGRPSCKPHTPPINTSGVPTTHKRTQALQLDAHSHTHKHIHAHPHTHPPNHTHTHTHTLARHTYIRNVHTHTHTHTHTDMHVHRTIPPAFLLVMQPWLTRSTHYPCMCVCVCVCVCLYRFSVSFFGSRLHLSRQSASPLHAAEDEAEQPHNALHSARPAWP